MDYYQILGLQKDASEADIKSAYRKLAMKHHPDRGGDEEEFKKIKEAYETLTDPVKRQAYDNPGHSNDFTSHRWDFRSADDIEELLRTHFGPGFNPFGRQRRQPKNKDLRIRVNLDLKDTLENITKILRVSLTDGSEETIEIDIPRGVFNGTVFKFDGKGDNLIKEYPRGDLLVEIVVRTPDNYEVHYGTVLTTITIDALTAMIGGKVSLKHFDGKEYEFTVKPGTQSNSKYKLPGLGIYAPNSFERGPLMVNLAVEIPSVTNDEMVNKLKEVFARQ